jgi:hypothetical protein
MTSEERTCRKDGEVRREDRPTTAQASPGGRKRDGFLKLRVVPQSMEARRLAALVLEVLAGVRTPAEAAALVGISPPRYYALEARALLGLVEALEKRPRGPRRTLEREFAELKREKERLARDCARSHALLRAAERTMGLSTQAQANAREKLSGKKRRARRVTRALRAAKALVSEGAANSLAASSGSGDDGAPVKR